MPDLNSEIVAYLTVNNISYSAGDYQTGKPEGQPNKVLVWNSATLGAEPTKTQLAESYLIWKDQQTQQQNKAEAAVLLTTSDWTAIPSVADPAISNPHLTNQADFLEYRSKVRAIAVNPPTTPALFPTEPTAIWSN